MKRIHTLLAIRCGLLFAASTCFAQMYTVTDLGTLGGDISVAYGINASGQVVGWSLTGGGDPSSGLSIHAFRTAPNRPINLATDDLGTLGGPFPYSVAYGINDSGDVVGGSYTSANTPGFCCIQHAFRTAPDRPIAPTTDDLGTLGGSNSTAYAINNAGQVVGDSDNGRDTCPTPHGSSPAQRAFRTAPNSPINPTADELGTLEGCWSVAQSINGSGQVVGMAQNKDGFLRAFRTAANEPINPATDDLGTLGGGTYSVANSINAFGQVVGYSSISADDANHGFRTAANAPINPFTDDLGPIAEAIYPAQPSPATGINNYGQVIGGSPAFVFGGGVMNVLDDLIPADSGWKLIMAYGINDTGQIVGMGAPGGASGYGVGRAYLLTPIYRAVVQQPINSDGSSVFEAKGGKIPVKFRLTQYNAQTCNLLPATISITRAADGKLRTVSEHKYGRGTSFKIKGCQYHYKLATKNLRAGVYRADISINGIMVGHAVFALR